MLRLVMNLKYLKVPLAIGFRKKFGQTKLSPI